MYRKWGRTKPPVGATIDRGHPLANGLAGYWAVNEGSGRILNNLITNRIATLTSVNWKGVAVFNGTSSLGVIGEPAGYSPLNLRKSGTVVFRFARTGPGSPDGNGVCDVANNLSLAGTDGWACGLNTTNNNWDFYIANNGGLGATLASNRPVIANGQYWTVAYTFSGTTKKIFVNGAFDNSALSTVDGNNTAQQWTFCRLAGNTTRFNQGNLDWVYINSRVLTASEIMQLYQEPYAMIRSPRSISYYLPYNVSRIAAAKGVLVGGGAIN